MENDVPTEPSASPAEQARRVLRDLDSDRASVASRLAAPWWLYPLLALIVAGFVATPAIGSDQSRSAVVGILIVGAIVLLLGYQRLSGVRVGRTGSRGGVLIAGLLVATLVMLSTSFGLAASLSAWWVLAPAAGSFAVVLVGGRWFDCLYRENLSRGHSASI